MGQGRPWREEDLLLGEPVVGRCLSRRRRSAASHATQTHRFHEITAQQALPPKPESGLEPLTCRLRGGSDERPELSESRENTGDSDNEVGLQERVRPETATSRTRIHAHQIRSTQLSQCQRARRVVTISTAARSELTAAVLRTRGPAAASSENAGVFAKAPNA